jgi:SAM-dependent methyltransferase
MPPEYVFEVTVSRPTPVEKTVSSAQRRFIPVESDFRLKSLDVGCGLGRHTIHHANVGFDVTAIDSSLRAVVHLFDYSFGSGGTSLASASVRRAFMTFSNCSSNLSLSFSHPVKSAASRAWISSFFPDCHSLLNMYPSRLIGMRARNLLPPTCINCCSFAKFLLISLSTHQLLRAASEQQSKIRSHLLIPRSTR